MKSSLLLVISLAALWLLLSGHMEALILAFGALSIAFVVWVSRRMNIIDRESYPFGLIPRLSGYYWPWLLKEIAKSSIDVTRRVFGPASAVRPVIFDAPVGLASDLGKVIYANSITLTPGTVSMNITGNAIRVHALHPDIARGLHESGMEARIPDAGKAEGARGNSP